MRKEWYAVIEWHPVGAVITLTQKPDEMRGIWVSDYVRDKEELHTLCHPQVAIDISIIAICVMAWEVVDDFKASRN